MPRKARSFQGNTVYHVMNRAAARAEIFRKEADYAAFERTLEEAHARIPLRILSYVIMPNHFHLVLWPARGDGQNLSEFMRWLQVTHVQRWHAHYHSSGTGALYQGRFKAFPVQGGFAHFQYPGKVCRYVERNPLRAGLVREAQAWRWGSLWRRLSGTPEQRALLAAWPEGSYPGDQAWAERVNRTQGAAEEKALQACIKRGRPFGDPAWVSKAAATMDLGHTLRPRGRPKKAEKVKQKHPQPRR